MEQQRTNWPAWIALGVSLVALIVAFGSMAVSQQSAWSMWTMPGWSNPPQVAPSGWGERGGPGHAKPPGPGHAMPPGPGHAMPPGPGHAMPPGPGHAMPPGPGHAMPLGPGRGDRGQVAPPAWRDHGGWMNPGIRGHDFGVMGGFGELIRFIDGLLKLAALALLIWLGFKIFRQRRNQPPSTNPPTTPQPPLTPAGHDPRVE